MEEWEYQCKNRLQIVNQLRSCMECRRMEKTKLAHSLVSGVSFKVGGSWLLLFCTMANDKHFRASNFLEIMFWTIYSDAEFYFLSLRKACLTTDSIQCVKNKQHCIRTFWIRSNPCSCLQPGNPLFSLENSHLGICQPSCCLDENAAIQ